MSDKSVVDVETRVSIAECQEPINWKLSAQLSICSPISIQQTCECAVKLLALVVSDHHMGQLAIANEFLCALELPPLIQRKYSLEAKHQSPIPQKGGKKLHTCNR